MKRISLWLGIWILAIMSIGCPLFVKNMPDTGDRSPDEMTARTSIITIGGQIRLQDIAFQNTTATPGGRLTIAVDTLQPSVTLGTTGLRDNGGVLQYLQSSSWVDVGSGSSTPSSGGASESSDLSQVSLITPYVLTPVAGYFTATNTAAMPAYSLASPASYAAPFQSYSTDFWRHTDRDYTFTVVALDNQPNVMWVQGRTAFGNITGYRMTPNMTNSQQWQTFQATVINEQRAVPMRDVLFESSGIYFPSDTTNASDPVDNHSSDATLTFTQDYNSGCGGFDISHNVWADAYSTNRSSIWFNGCSWLTFNYDHALFNLSDGNPFSIEFWISTEQTTGTHYILYNGEGADGWAVGFDDGELIVEGVNGGVWSTGLTGFTNGYWHYIAVTREGSTLHAWVDSSHAQVTLTSLAYNSSGGLRFGIGWYFSNVYMGLIDDLVFERTVTHRQPMTPPTVQYSDRWLAEPSSLAIISDDFAGNATSYPKGFYNISTVGSVTQPTGNGWNDNRSLYFSGSGYLQLAGDADLWDLNDGQDFAISMMIQCSSPADTVYLLYNNTSATGWSIWLSYGELVVTGQNAGDSWYTYLYPCDGNWNQLAIQRDGSVLQAWLNTSYTYTTISSAFRSNDSSGLRIGSNASSNFFTGYIDDFYFTNSVRFENPITLPIEALQDTDIELGQAALTESDLVLHLSGGFVNESSILNTGGAQAIIPVVNGVSWDTSQKKFGTASLHRDVGDSITFPQNEAHTQLTLNWDCTLSFWVRFPLHDGTTAQTQYLWNNYSTVGQRIVTQWDSTNQSRIIFYGAPNGVGDPWTLANLPDLYDGQWHWIAIQHTINSTVDVWIDGRYHRSGSSYGGFAYPDGLKKGIGILGSQPAGNPFWIEDWMFVQRVLWPDKPDMIPVPARPYDALLSATNLSGGIVFRQNGPGATGDFGFRLGENMSRDLIFHRVVVTDPATKARLVYP